MLCPKCQLTLMLVATWNLEGEIFCTHMWAQKKLRLHQLAGVSVEQGPAVCAHVFAITVCVLNSFGLIFNTHNFQGKHFLSHFITTDGMLENLNILPEGS